MTKSIEHEKRNPFKSLIVLVLGLLGLIYLLNPTAGVIEILPDNLPFIGNLDEAAAVGLLIGALRYFGVDLTRWFRRDQRSENGS